MMDKMTETRLPDGRLVWNGDFCNLCLTRVVPHELSKEHRALLADLEDLVARRTK